jgi:LuxR family maltose regulon positive regulatory protein
MESYILLAIAYWKKGRGLQKEALELLERAVLLAQEYEFTQVFANVGADIQTMLYKLQNRVAQKTYKGERSGPYVKMLYITALAHAKQFKGLTGGSVPDSLKFTEQQKTVMRYLCEGLTHKAIGEKMGLKPSAIKSHMILIYKKLDVSNGIDAMIKIQELGVLV